jgi:zinc protease
MPARLDPRYHAVDLMADLLGRGKSSRLHQRLVKELELFNNVSASLTGALDPGLLVISGKLNTGVALEEADRAVEAVVAELLQADVPAAELDKVKNQAETGLIFGEIELLNRALALAIGKLLGNANLVNEEPAMLQAVTPADIRQAAELVLRPENCTTLYYRAAESEAAPEVEDEVVAAA